MEKKIVTLGILGALVISNAVYAADNWTGDGNRGKNLAILASEAVELAAGNTLDIRNPSGKRVGYVDGKDIRDTSGKRVGYIDGSDVRDTFGKRIGYMDGSDIRDTLGKRIGYVDGKDIRDTSGRRVGYVDSGASRVQAGAAGLLLFL
ncbi:MAG: hypothetical protein LBK00_10945 [Treponema sp.]|jgi:hypothetical protein|nr:hypothetical protein [Treponema sp.]